MSECCLFYSVRFYFNDIHCALIVETLQGPTVEGSGCAHKKAVITSQSFLLTWTLMIRGKRSAKLLSQRVDSGK